MPALLSEDKARAIRQLHYQNACKVFIEFTQRFWTRSYPGLDAGAKPITGGYSVTDLPVREIWYPSEEHIKLHTMGRPGGVLLASYTWGDDSLRWTALRRDDRIRFALRDLAMVHNREPHPGGRRVLEEIFVGGLSHSWAEDEFTSGAFANFEPFQLTELFEYIWRPENVGPDDEPVGSIHYCGEHTSLRHGWIEGAVESAIRVAKEICDTYAHDRQRS